MSGLEQRIGKLEAAAELEEQQMWVEALVQAGMSRAEALADYRQCKATMEEHPAVEVGNGMVDIEPTVRALAEALGLDPDEAVRDAERLLAEDVSGDGA